MSYEYIDFDEVKQARELPSPTGIALNIMRMCRNENVSLRDLARQIQADPALAGRLIKLANAERSPGLRPVVAISTEVLLLLGVHVVRQVALGVSLINSYQSGACHAFDFNGFWSRSLSMACVAQAIGQQVMIAPPAELFTCGLLASIGQLGLAIVRPKAYAEILTAQRAAPFASLRRSERQRFGCDQIDLSIAMLRDWNIPGLFVDAVSFHREPALSGWEEDNRRQRLARILYVAAQAAAIDLTSAYAQEALIPALSESFALLGLNDEQAIKIIEQASQDVIEWRQLLHFSA